VVSVFVIGGLFASNFIFPEATGLDVQEGIQSVDQRLATQGL
jgi:hypothetical protein